MVPSALDLPDDPLVSQIDRCHDRGWTDGLPVIPPTPARVDGMLGPLAARRHEVVAVLPPAQGEATLETVAANAVMAGCLPAHLPVVLAAVRALSRPRAALDEVATSVHAMAPVVIVDGPVVEQLGFNASTGVLGAGNRSNAAVGRAVQLCIRNIGGAHPGALDAATHGHPGKYSFLVAAQPGPWTPLGERLGFPPGTSTVTVKAADAPLCIADIGHDDPETILDTLAASVAIPGSYNAFFREELWLVMGPEHSARLDAAGWTPPTIATALHHRATIPAGRLRETGIYGFIDDALRPSWLDDADDATPISIVDHPNRVHIIVAGGPAGGYTAALLGQGVSTTEVVRW